MDRLKLDWTHLTADAVGPDHGITEAELEALREPSAAALRAVRARAEQDLRFQTLHSDRA